MTDPIGYSFNNGGLNNQRLALLGLFIEGFERKKSIVLPYMYNKNVLLENNSLAPLENATVPAGEVFDLPGIERLASKYGIAIDPASPAPLAMGGWSYFGLGAGSVSALALNAKPTETSALVRDFFFEVVPLARRSYLMSHLKQDIFRSDRAKTRFFAAKDPMLAVQFRIESDWRFYSEVTLRPTIGDEEDFYIPYERIAGKIRKTLPNVRRVLAIYDEAAANVTKDEVRHVCKKKFGLELVWKSDFLTSFEVKALGPLALSMIDFELAIAADHFVGLSRSTFSNMVTFEKAVTANSKIVTDFIYNMKCEELRLRTDNGAHADPREATR